MASVENIEWLNQNMLRAYPLKEDADVTPLLTSGTKATGVTVPTCLVTDFSFTLAFDAVEDGTVPSLTGLSHAADGFSFEISLGDVVLATLSVSISGHETNKSYRLSGSGDNADCGGWLALGDLERAAKEMPEGVYSFPANQVPFEVSTLRVAPRGVRSVTAVGKYGLKTYSPLYGNVKIIAGSDMTVRNDAPKNAIWLQAESGTGYERTAPCKCGSAAVQNVRSINGMSVADVQIVGDGTCVKVDTNASTKAITVSDTCSTPCCGCSELNFVESAVATVSKSIGTLTSYAEVLKARVEELQTNKATTEAALAAYPS
jgi:hypothetical protein